MGAATGSIVPQLWVLQLCPGSTLPSVWVLPLAGPLWRWTGDSGASDRDEVSRDVSALRKAAFPPAPATGQN